MIKPNEKHIIVSAAVSLTILITFIILGATNVLIINPEQLPSTLLTTAGIFIGFTISALGIYYSIPLREEIKVALIKQGYYKQVARNFIISIISFTVVIIVSIISICIYSEQEYLLAQHILNSFSIACFIFAIILLVLTCINFFKIVIKNR
ncbi:MAG: hypothetical protein K2I30_05015 [Clostridia bacterium]|nr:hypothetical protein [Clostridia bacterium]